MILSNNAFNWAMLRSVMGTGDFMASLTPEREEELFKAYNEWRRSRGLPEEAAPVAAPAPTATATPAAPEQRKETATDPISAMFTQVAAEVEEEEAEEAALVQNALDGADEIVEEEAAAPVPDEIVEENEADELDEPIPEDAAPMDTEVGAAPEVTTTPAVAAEAAAAVDFSTIIRSLPKESDPALYSRIKDQYGEETKSMAQAALKEATAKHRGTAAIRAFLAWLEQENED